MSRWRAGCLGVVIALVSVSRASAAPAGFGALGDSVGARTTLRHTRTSHLAQCPVSLSRTAVSSGDQDRNNES